MDSSTLLYAAIAGALVSVILQGFKKINTWLDQQSAWQKRLLLGLLSAGAVFLGERIGVAVPPDVLNLDGAVLEGILIAVMGHLTHAGKKALAGKGT